MKVSNRWELADDKIGDEDYWVVSIYISKKNPLAKAFVKREFDAAYADLMKEFEK